MAAKVLTKLEGQLNCSICLDVFTNPKLLQCSHIFCQQCLARLVRRDQRGQASLTCPTCRQPTLIPANGVNFLSSAVHISQLLDILEEHKAIESAIARKSHFCLEHDKKEVDLYCETCGELVCWKCIKKAP